MSFSATPSAALAGGFENVPSKDGESLIHGARFRHEHEMRYAGVEESRRLQEAEGRREPDDLARAVVTPRDRMSHGVPSLARITVAASPNEDVREAETNRVIVRAVYEEDGGDATRSVPAVLGTTAVGVPVVRRGIELSVVCVETVPGTKIEEPVASDSMMTVEQTPDHLGVRDRRGRAKEDEVVPCAVELLERDDVRRAYAHVDR